MKHAFETIEDMVGRESDSRIWGGMHFRTTLRDSRTPGAQTAAWVVAHHFQPRAQEPGRP